MVSPSPTLAANRLPTALSPERLDESTAAAARALVREGTPSNTTTSYSTALRYWQAWHLARYHRPMRLPLPVPAVVQFLVDHLQVTNEKGELEHGLPAALDQHLMDQGAKARLGPLSLKTVEHRLSVLSAAHRAQELVNPCRAELVTTMLARARRAYARRGALPRKAPALTKEPLQAMLDTCDGSLEGLRDRALLLFAWASGGRRRSEVVRATCENTVRVPEGFLYALGYSKTRQNGDATLNMKPILGPAGAALDAWLTASGISEGPLFRRVRRGGVIGEPLAAAAVRDIVRKRARRAGLDADFTAHSLRSGFVTESGRQNIPMPEGMAMSDHASPASFIGYYRAGAVTQSRAARLLDKTDDKPL